MRGSFIDPTNEEFSEAREDRKVNCGEDAAVETNTSI
jgi:hypothetical protein